MSRFRVLYTDRGDYSHDFSLEEPIYAGIDAEIVDARLDHNAIDWDQVCRAALGGGRRRAASACPWTVGRSKPRRSSK